MTADIGRIIAFDPGISGGFGVCDSLGRLVAAGELPTSGDGTRRMLAAPLIAALLRRYRPELCIIERVGAMPGQGVSSMFRFGKAAGILEGVVGAAEIPLLFVASGVWKRHFNLPAAKEAARARAIETWPAHADLLFRRKCDHGAAEAALIALWGARAHLAGGANASN
ncbi:hypothetical protein [Mesorhizobium sp. ES1-3]|uniref:hypothetical protein n=1 Tax=Mesorhizobium sp. ES1-3 TaxID=2876628 RepID=UPI001CCFCE45|nr:hypothetical protein [Mesorhizobium sp. ES1-3]MBZ9673440.1 hypothetical protein [Mesorhizobium sp. ES1-3]